MTEGEGNRVDEMSRVIGGLQADVRNLLDTWQRQDHEATEGRRRLHAKFDIMNESMIRLTGRVDQMGLDISRLQPAMVLSDQERHQAIGSKKMLATVWSALVLMVSALAWSAVEIAHLIFPPKPPLH